MKLILRTKEGNVRTLVDTDQEPNYMEIYNDEEGNAFPVATVGTEIEEADIMVQNTVVVDIPEVVDVVETVEVTTAKKRGRKPGKSIAKKAK